MVPVTVRGPGEVIAVLPFQLGYHPSDAVVVVTIRDGTLGMIARSDLPPGQFACEVAERLVGPVLRTPPDGVLLVGYESERASADVLLEILAADFGRAGVDVTDSVVVRDGRWRSLLCRGDCCPPEGRPLPDMSRTPAVAEFVGLGVAPLPDRDALEGLVAPAESAPGVEAALRRLGPIPDGGGGAQEPEVLAPAATAWGRLCHLGEGAVPVDALDDDEVGRIVHSLRDHRWRDAVIAHLCPGTLPDDVIPEQVRDEVVRAIPFRPWADELDPHESVVASRRLRARLQAVARRVPSGSAAPLLTVLAHVAWHEGDGAVARTALEKALEVAPGYRLAQLLTEMVDLALRPSRS
jgi:hypothetical protein